MRKEIHQTCISICERVIHLTVCNERHYFTFSSILQEAIQKVAFNFPFLEQALRQVILELFSKVNFKSNASSLSLDRDESKA